MKVLSDNVSSDRTATGNPGAGGFSAGDDAVVDMADNACPGFSVTVRLHRGACRWPVDASDAERRAWSAGFTVSAKRQWSVRQLVTEVEDLLLDKFRVELCTALVISLARDTAVPFYEPLVDFVAAEDTLELVGDVERVHGASVPSGGVGHARDGDAAAAAATAIPGGVVETSPPVSRTVPVTILTGFLGAGKTTMLNHLLHVQRDKRIAVIENEFGEVPIDGDLLADGDGLSAAEQVVVLDNGCMCCTVRGDLLGAFASVLAKTEEAEAKAGNGDGRTLDSVLVETTGMADPVPIVRTLLQTPAISKAFSLDGVVTLVDAKNILPRLREGELEEPVKEKDGPEKEEEEEVDEAFQQIMFSDRIVVNKVDLVTAATAVEVFERVRSINATAGMVSCSRGRIDPGELQGLGAFDRLMREADEEVLVEEPHAHDHSHSHSHGHDHDHDSACHDAENCTQGGPREEEVGDCTLEHDHTDHSNGHSNSSSSNRHNTQVGTFSLVLKSTEVLALPFARWVRSLAFLPKDKGTLFRSKAVLAVAGSDRKLVFHAVSDVMERREAGRWGDGEDRSCRIVFIGKRLDRPFLEEGFRSTARVVLPRPIVVIGGASCSSPPDKASLNGKPNESFLEEMAGKVPSAFYLVLMGLGTGEVLTVGEACSGMATAVDGGQAAEHCQSLMREQAASSSKGFHLSLRRSSPKYYLHPLVSAATARSYAKAAAGAKLEIVPSMGQGRYGISFGTSEDVEAAGITWLEVEQLADPLAKNFVVEFSWRPETMTSFFDSPGASTSSTMAKIEYEVEDEDAFDEEVDTLKFRLVLRPETDANNEASSESPPPLARNASLSALGGASTGGGGGGGGGVMESMAGAGTENSALPLHRLMIQTVGGRSCSQVYGLSFHSISPSFQVHVQVPDHRVSYFQTDQLFHKWHPLMEHLKEHPCLRFLVRMKPDGSGPLDNMCGCC